MKTTRRQWTKGGLISCGLLLAACGWLDLPRRTEEAGLPPTDPLIAFVERANPGAEEMIVLAPNGDRARVRLLRIYHAASGRECREVLVAAGLQSRHRILCRGGEGWREARPLISGR